MRSVGREAWFAPVRDLALGAYFSSEIGMTQALRYVRVPGKYIGCMPLASGQCEMLGAYENGGRCSWCQHAWEKSQDE